MLRPDLLHLGVVHAKVSLAEASGNFNFSLRKAFGANVYLLGYSCRI